MQKYGTFHDNPVPAATGVFYLTADVDAALAEKDKELAAITKNRDECAKVFEINRLHSTGGINGHQWGNCECPSCFLHVVYKWEIASLKAELETERLRLAACGVAALANTEKSAKDERIGKDYPCYSASYADVCGAVDREMAYRELIASLKAEVESLHKTIQRYEEYDPNIAYDAREEAT